MRVERAVEVLGRAELVSGIDVLVGGCAQGKKPYLLAGRVLPLFRALSTGSQVLMISPSGTFAAKEDASSSSWSASASLEAQR